MINSNTTAQINESLRDLNHVWNASAVSWQDEARRIFEEQHLTVLRSLITDALQHMGDIEQAIQQAVRLCR